MLVTKRDCSPSSYYITFLPNVYIHLAGKTPSWLVDHEPSQSSLFKTMHLKVLSVKWLLFCSVSWCVTSHWRHNDRDGVWNHQPHDCLLNCLFRSKKTSKLRVTGLCAGNSPVAGEFPAVTWPPWNELGAKSVHVHLPCSDRAPGLCIAIKMSICYGHGAVSVQGQLLDYALTGCQVRVWPLMGTVNIGLEHSRR